MSMPIFAMVTKQGTATSETALCGQHFTPNGVALAMRQAQPDVIPNSWENCGDNEELQCNVCGINSDGKFETEH